MAGTALHREASPALERQFAATRLAEATLADVYERLLSRSAIPHDLESPEDPREPKSPDDRRMS